MATALSVHRGPPWPIPTSHFLSLPLTTWQAPLCTAQGLRNLLHNSCSHILLATADTLVSPHLFLHLPPHVPLSADAMDTGTAPSSLHSFRFRTPDEVCLLVQSTFSDQLSHAAACRTAVTEVDLQDAHFPPLLYTILRLLTNHFCGLAG